MTAVLELDQVKANFSTGLGGMDHARKATNLEKMSVQIVTPTEKFVQPPTAAVQYAFPRRSSPGANKGRSPGQRKPSPQQRMPSPGQRRASPGNMKPAVLGDRFGGKKPF